jgi:hypothetical protein
MSIRTAPQTRVPRSRRNSAVVVRGADSWLGLVAATTKGVGERRRVRVRIRATAPIKGDAFRLIVQSYAASSYQSSGPPVDSSTPVASLQRAVSPEELQLGLDLDVMHVGCDGHIPSEFIVFAWVEPGQPDLEYDAALARPSNGALCGSAFSQRDLARGLTAELSLTAA